MSFARARRTIIRSRVHSAKQLLAVIGQKPLSDDQVVRLIYVRLVMASCAIAQYERCVANGWNSVRLGRQQVPREEFLDQAKALLEFDIPVLMLQLVAPDERSRVAAHAIRQFREDQSLCGELLPLVTTSRGLDGRRGYSPGDVDDVVAWFQLVVEATIKADYESWFAGVPSRWFRSFR